METIPTAEKYRNVNTHPLTDCAIRHLKASRLPIESCSRPISSQFVDLLSVMADVNNPKRTHPQSDTAKADDRMENRRDG